MTSDTATSSTATSGTARPDAARTASPYMYGGEAAAVAAVLAGGQYGHTAVTERFEQAVADFLPADDVIAVSSGTTALQLALQAAGIGAGHEVVVPSMTFTATVQAILAAGAQPRFADIDPRTLCVTADTVEDALTRRTAAVIPVLYGGRAVDLTGVMDRLTRRGIEVIEDAAQAFGSRRGGTRVGADPAVTTCFSFGPIKSLTCGQGGAVIPRTRQQGAVVRRLRMLGVAETAAQRAASTTYRVTGPGYRAQMPALNAAIGSVQLDHFHIAERTRRDLWRLYRDALAGVDGVALVDVDADQSVPSMCVVRVPGRDRVFARLRALGVGVGVHYPPNHLQPAFADWHRPLPVTEQVAGQILTLPFHQHLTADDVCRVARLLTDTVHSR